MTVTVRHADGTQADYTVTRALVTQTNTTVSVTGGVGYIDCDSFARRRGRIFKRACAGMTALCTRGSWTFAATAGG